MTEYVYADMVPTGSTCPELRMRVDDIEAAFMRYQAAKTRIGKAREIEGFSRACQHAMKQALIEINALHDEAKGAV